MQECVPISVSSEALSLQTSNGRTTVPRRRLGRSPILQEAVEDCEMYRHIELTVPAGFAEAWGQLLQLEDESVASSKHTVDIPSRSLLLYVKVWFFSYLACAVDGVMAGWVHSALSTDKCLACRSQLASWIRISRDTAGIRFFL